MRLRKLVKSIVVWPKSPAIRLLLVIEAAGDLTKAYLDYQLRGGRQSGLKQKAAILHAYIHKYEKEL